MKKTSMVSVMMLLCSLPVLAADQDGTSTGHHPAVEQAFHLRLDGKVDEAKVLLDEELATRPENADAWFELARLEVYRSVSTGNMDPAQKAIEKAQEIAPDNARYHCLAGLIAAYNFIMKAHAKKPDEMPIQMEKATAALERALDINPDLHEARFLLVSCYGNNPPEHGGDRAKAQQHLETLEKRSPVVGAQARCEFSVHEPKERLSLWTKLADRCADDPRYHESLAHAHLDVGNVEEGISHVDRALELEPDRPLVLLELGIRLAHSRKLEHAQEALQRYLDHEPPAPVSLRAYATFILGKVQDLNGDHEAAENLMKKAKELDSYCWFTMQPPPEQLFLDL